MLNTLHTVPQAQERLHRVSSLIAYLLLIASFALLGTYVDAKNPDVKSKVAKTTLGGYIQAQFLTTNEEDAVPNNTFTIRSERVQFKSELTDSLSTTLEIDAKTDGFEAKDIYLGYKISPKFSLKVGQMKKPFSFAYLQAIYKSPMIERPLHVRKYFDSYLGRDVGLIAEWEPHKRIELAMGVFNGAGSGENAATDNNNAKDFVGRVELMPTKWLTMAFNASSHGLTEDSNDTTLADKRVTAYGADLSFNRGGFQAVAEGLFGDKTKGDVDAQMIGLYLTVTHKRELKDSIIAAVENGGRIEFADKDRTIDNNAVTSITPYIGFYFHQNARLQICPILRFPQQGDAILEFITQAQIEF
jgi:hypothetical protein